IPASWIDAATPSNRFTFTPHREEYLGAERLVYGEVGPTKVVGRFAATAPLQLSLGQPVEFAVSNQHMRYFEAESGIRVKRAP
ncbi:MAG: hypothetical protein AB7V46_02820, partial [Thermomicrobiales bacterium]